MTFDTTTGFTAGDIILGHNTQHTLLVLEQRDGWLRGTPLELCAEAEVTGKEVLNASDFEEWHRSTPLCVDLWQNIRLARADAHKYELCGRLKISSLDRLLRMIGHGLAHAHYTAIHSPPPFHEGVSSVPVSGKHWGPEEMENLLDASLDFWLTAGRFCRDFEKRLAYILERKFALAVNSGSSANLLAISALCSPLLHERRLKPGDEVITVAAGFPTTVAPIVQMGLVPVFVDIGIPDYNALPGQIAAAVGPRTRAIFLAHTLGNPFDLDAVTSIAKEHELWLVEDSCDALGSLYSVQGSPRPCGSFGHISTLSFYPAHHITTGEGGAVACDDPLLHKILLSLRDWGRDCWCAPGADDSCRRRFSQKFSQLPQGYDHKYVYSHLGYNLKFSDMQAAVGLAQLQRLEAFTKARRRNFAFLSRELADLDGGPLILPQPTPRSSPSWFGFLITLDPSCNREDILRWLDFRKIGTRLLFAGNITRQPCFAGVPHRLAAPLRATDIVMRQTFWIGLYPSLTEEHLAYSVRAIRKFFRQDTGGQRIQKEPLHTLETTDRDPALPDPVALIVFDFDGVFTDNRVLTLEDGTEAVFCNRGDGLGIDRLRKAGIPLLICSTETNPVVGARSAKLGIPVQQGCGDKAAFLRNWLRRHHISPEHVVYMGNDINDREAMRIVGYGWAPADAHPEILAIASHITRSCGGRGAVRELADAVLARAKIS